MAAPPPLPRTVCFKKDQLGGLLWNSLIVVTSAPENGRPKLSGGPRKAAPCRPSLRTGCRPRNCKCSTSPRLQLLVSVKSKFSEFLFYGVRSRLSAPLFRVSSSGPLGSEAGRACGRPAAVWAVRVSRGIKRCAGSCSDRDPGGDPTRFPFQRLLFLMWFLAKSHNTPHPWRWSSPR